LPKQGYFPGPPDLAVEVLSPHDTASEVLSKVQDWLDAGTASVWIADPERKTVSIYHGDAPVRLFREGDEVTDEDILPGLCVSVNDIFR
jgi:Uma2 family endonuclease